MWYTRWTIANILMGLAMRVAPKGASRDILDKLLADYSRQVLDAVNGAQETTDEKPRIIAKKGERVTDENGNTVCYVAQDIYPDDPICPTELFERWEVQIPAFGEPVDLTPGFRTINMSGYVEICIEGEWRP